MNMNKYLDINPEVAAAIAIEGAETINPDMSPCSVKERAYR